MPHFEDISLEQHLKEERAAYTTPAVLNIQISALLELFYREWLALDFKRRKIIEELEYHTVGKDRVVFEDVISRKVLRWCDENSPACNEHSVPSRLSRVVPPPELLFRHCFLPYRESETNALRRRPVGSDIIVMESPELSVGRVFVSMHMVRRGETILVETPFFTSLIAKSEAAEEILPPPAIRETMNVVQQQSAVFATQGWHTRLLHPFYHCLTEMVFGEKGSDFVGR
ncbi:hypothetical protein LSM04_002812 [Trypanosoma melophagium]|uniref:uncharacterized protein n=1 Tax=Trypanosoma melophagium TaxID=715481 RepID=UPI00351A3393|nr:hypothetical protein LSM04_002812 [Trypanosoma melophagium]